MNEGISGNSTTVRPSRDDRCRQCGEVVGDEWISYRQKADDPQPLVRHFAGVIKAGPIEPKLKTPERTARDFRYPDDLDVFFHSWCAPKVHLPEKLQRKSLKYLLSESSPRTKKL